MLLICLTFSVHVAKDEVVKQKSASTSVKTFHLIDAKRQAGETRASRSEVRKPVGKKGVSHSSHSATKSNKEKYSARKQPLNKKVSLTGIAACIGKYESGNNPTAQNPVSSASGYYQFTNGTWGNYKGYARAKDAPLSVQTERFYQIWAGGKGAHHWQVRHKCGY